MEHCCSKKASELESMKHKKQAKVLWIVLFLNLIMFFVEMYSGFFANSTALMSDGLDMLGDAFVYGFSIFVITVLFLSSSFQILKLALKDLNQISKTSNI